MIVCLEEMKQPSHFHKNGAWQRNIEKQAEYVEIANKRLEYYKGFKEENEPDLFDEAINH